MILDEIIRHKQVEVAQQRAETPLAELKALCAGLPDVRDFAVAIARPVGYSVRLIAEVKKASPSKGVIREDFDPVEIARAYEANGASAISVLTDEKFFQGRLRYVTDVKAAVKIPVLRKDFVIDEYQIYQSRAIGADAILLIVAALTKEQLAEFLDIAGELGLHCLVEVHDESELEVALAAGARVVGVNNRNLRTFEVDIRTTARLAALMAGSAMAPDVDVRGHRGIGRGHRVGEKNRTNRTNATNETVLVSESGIHTREDVELVAAAGAQAILVGESLMRSQDIGAKMRELIG